MPEILQFPRQVKDRQTLLLPALLRLVGRLIHEGIGADWPEMDAARAALSRAAMSQHPVRPS